jgi:N6-L-threonylcarbamoyladenine synthase
MNILGIETSADDTCAAIVKDGKEILSNIVSSQERIHAKYGGIVPELAARQHINNIIPVINLALKISKTDIKDVDAFAATGASNSGVFINTIVGTQTAATLSYIYKKPFILINHMEAHMFASFAEYNDLSFPFLALIVSGGHTMIVWAKMYGKYELLGETRDDAAGEAFDKVGRLIGLKYPAGPKIDRLAKIGNSKAYNFPRPMILSNNYDFSFSGLKTSVMTKLRSKEIKISNQNKKDIAASFQQSVVDVLTYKTLKALKEKGSKKLVIGGGVAANSQLRFCLSDKTRKLKIRLFHPSLELCTDNAVGVATLGYYKFKHAEIENPLKFNPVFSKGLGV